MNKVRLTLAVCDYDRSKTIFLGRTPIEGCDVLPLAVNAEECFHRAFKFHEFDVSELSMSSHMATVARGENAYVGVPAFVSRVFRHSGIYIRTDRAINKPQDLRGKAIGLPEYQITANVWIRGILQDDHGIRAQDVHWQNGGIEEPGREERTPLELPPGIDLKPIPKGKTLSAMLEAGELDGMIGARPPSCFTRGAPGVARMFPDFRATEQEYFARTRMFPIMHIIGIRKRLLEEHPWLAVNVMQAFVEAKKLCWYELGQIGHLFNSLPWGVAEFDATRKLMGEDYWSYGLQSNRHVLEAFTRYHHEQGLSSKRMEPEALFAPSACDLSKL